MRLLRSPLAVWLGFLGFCCVALMYALLFAFRHVDVRSCERQIPVREAAKTSYALNAGLQRLLADVHPATARARLVVADRWDRLAVELVVPACDEIPYPWPF